MSLGTERIRVIALFHRMNILIEDLLFIIVLMYCAHVIKHGHLQLIKEIHYLMWG
jgi:hypothetical protein